MWSFFLSLGEKLIDRLISLRVKPTVLIDDFRIESENTENKIIHFSALISNNGDKTLSVSQKHLIFYSGKEVVADIDTTRYEIIKKQDGFDDLNILSPIDDIITISPGETKKIKIVDQIKTDKTITKVVFTYYTGRKNYKQDLSFDKAGDQTNSNNVDTSKENDTSDIDIIKRAIRFINENIKAFTWISTVLVAIFTAVLKFSQYAFEAGKVKWLKIDPAAIEINSNTLYGMLLSIVLGVLLLLITLIPFIVHKTEFKNLFIKALAQIGVFLGFGIAISVMCNVTELLDLSNKNNYIVWFVAVFITYVLFFAPSLIFGIAFRKKRKKTVPKEQSFKAAIVFLVLWVVFSFGYTYAMGILSVCKQTEYRVTQDGYAVVYENNQMYYLSKYEIEEGKIICDHTKQKAIKKQDNIEFNVISEKTEQ